MSTVAMRERWNWLGPSAVALLASCDATVVAFHPRADSGAVDVATFDADPCAPRPNVPEVLFALPATSSGLDRVVQLEAVGNGWCAVRADGSVVCWASGLIPSPAPGELSDPWQAVEVLPAGTAVEIVFGGVLCVRRPFGSVACTNYATRETPSSPLRLHDVPLIDDAVQIAYGAPGVCALRRDGTVWCWNTLTPDETPTRVAGLVEVVEIRGECARLRSGEVRCRNPGRPADLWTVPGLRDAVELRSEPSAESYCARRASGRLLCWWGGRDLDEPALPAGHSFTMGNHLICTQTCSGEVVCVRRGDDSRRGPGRHPNPTIPFSLPMPARLSLGVLNACALLAGGRVVCGTHTYGDGLDSPREIRTPFDTPRDALFLGIAVTCGRHRSGEVTCVGETRHASGPTPNRGPNSRTPRSVPELTGATAVAWLPDGRPCAVLSAGVVRCDGAPVAGLDDVVELANPDPSVESWELCARRRDGTVWCWDAGRNLDPPQRVPEIRDAVQLAGGCVRHATGTISCRSGFMRWQRRVSDITDAVDIDVGARVGGETGCALRAHGHVACWRRSRYEDDGAPFVAREVAVIDDGVDVAVATLSHGRFACVRRRSGGVECFGDTPTTALPGVHDAVAIAGSFQHLCALRADGSAVCVGSDDSGQLGGSMFHAVWEPPR